MRNYESKKNIVILAIILIVIVLGITGIVTRNEYKSYSRKYNEKLNSIALTIREQHPEISDAEIMEIMNSSVKGDDFFHKYGIDLNEDSVMLENDGKYRFFIWINLTIVAAVGVLLLLLVLLVHRKREQKIEKMTAYLKDINDGNYIFDMEDSVEGEMAALESEIYKTTIMLKEAANNSLSEKQRLKDSLSDISHQLKTPLTSLVINLDNLKDNPDMDEESQKRLISMAKRDTNKINQMVQQLLTLSKLDANVIEFKKEQIALGTIINEALLNVEALSDLKGIPVVYEQKVDEKCFITCDRDWEIQAVTNILKNGIEHADTRVTISCQNYELYKEIIIGNDGEPIGETERKNIFNRFYSGEHTTKDSVGIGLSIAHAVVTNDGGYITVKSDENAAGSGVKFIIRYV